ncbi:hypothetical protein RS9916_33897 [Synechococcus sp. RS9916]|nr:hypothetical protein RS9916_33897 [Synechococcus sp. RS9916]
MDVVGMQASSGEVLVISSEPKQNLVYGSTPPAGRQ